MMEWDGMMEWNDGMVNMELPNISKSSIIFLQDLPKCMSGMVSHTVATRIKEPTFIRTWRLKFNILNP